MKTTMLKALTLLGLVGAAHAVSTGTSTFLNGASMTTGFTSYMTGYFAYDNANTTTSATVIRSTLMTVQTKQNTEMLQDAIANEVAAMGGNTAGETAGDSKEVASSTSSMRRMSSFLRLGHTSFKNSSEMLGFGGDNYAAMLGVSYRFTDRIAVGLGASGAYTEVDTAFNKGKVKETTFGLNPYMVLIAHKNVYLEAMGGYSWGKSDNTRRWLVQEATNGRYRLSLPNTHDVRFTAKPKVNTMYGAFFVNLVHKMNKTSMNLKVGYTAIQAKMKSFVETAALASYTQHAKSVPQNTYKVQTVSGKLKVGFDWSPTVTPFIQFHGGYDVKEATKVTWANASKSGLPTEYKPNRTAFGGGFGIDARHDDQLSGSIKAEHTKRGTLNSYVTTIGMTYAF